MYGLESLEVLFVAAIEDVAVGIAVGVVSNGCAGVCTACVVVWAEISIGVGSIADIGAGAVAIAVGVVASCESGEGRGRGVRTEGGMTGVISPINQNTTDDRILQ